MREISICEMQNISGGTKSCPSVFNFSGNDQCRNIAPGKGRGWKVTLNHCTVGGALLVICQVGGSFTLSDNDEVVTCPPGQMVTVANAYSNFNCTGTITPYR